MTSVVTGPGVDQGFLDGARAFLDSRCARKDPDAVLEYGVGSDDVGLLDERTPAEEQALVAAGRAFKQAEYDAGYAWIDGPPAYGGASRTVADAEAYHALRAEYEVPELRMFSLGLGMTAPTILAHGTPATKERYLRALYRGDLIACQLFSEPGAGSDLAGLRCRAVPVDGGWRLTGQKVWTTGAHLSDVGEILCRTDPDAPKHRGITAFLVDMHAAGVTVRPLRQMTGGASFNEVFLDEVFVPDDHRLGEVNDGWRVAMTTLMNERHTAGQIGGGLVPTLDRLVLVARELGRTEDPAASAALVDAWLHVRVGRAAARLAQERVDAGHEPGPELSMHKLAWTQNLQRIDAAAQAVLRSRYLADTGVWGTYAWNVFGLGVPGIRVSAGTDQIMRNTLAERVLGLPREASPAKENS